MIDIVLSSIYFFLPAYAANTFACILGHGRPVDLGKNFVDGNRILGDGVTIRGSAAGVVSGTAAAFIMQYYGGYSLLTGILLSAGAVTGDAAGSFIKRRLGMKRGAPAPLLDQLNFVVGGLFFASFVSPIETQTIVVLFVLTPIAHLAVNKTGYLLKMKDVPW